MAFGSCRSTELNYGNQLQKPVYVTKYGQAYLGDAYQLLKCLSSNSVDLIITSPPLPYNAKKATEMKTKNPMLIGY
jgi:site-specific DNA-methyltransferase (cytosine-N4-specific)